MDKIIGLLVFILYTNTFVWSQHLLVQYNYVKKESKVSSDKFSQNSYLQIDGTSSIFFSEVPFLADSIMNANEKAGQKIDFKNLPQDALLFFIKKDLKTNVVSYYSNEFDETEYVYDETLKPLWKLGNEQKYILGYPCTSANINYGGRNYTAFFTEKIPISEGPYKFFGLPGLIMEIYDEDDDHHFFITGVSKEKVMSVERMMKKTYAKTSKEKFFEMRKNHIEAPLLRFYELMNSTGITERKDKEGNTIDMRKLARETEQRIKEEYKNENLIEIIEL